MTDEGFIDYSAAAAKKKPLSRDDGLSSSGSELEDDEPSPPRPKRRESVKSNRGKGDGAAAAAKSKVEEPSVERPKSRGSTRSKRSSRSQQKMPRMADPPTLDDPTSDLAGVIDYTAILDNLRQKGYSTAPPSDEEDSADELSRKASAGLALNDKEDERPSRRRKSTASGKPSLVAAHQRSSSSSNARSEATSNSRSTVDTSPPSSPGGHGQGKRAVAAAYGRRLSKASSGASVGKRTFGFGKKGAPAEDEEESALGETESESEEEEVRTPAPRRASTATNGSRRGSAPGSPRSPTGAAKGKSKASAAGLTEFFLTPQDRHYLNKALVSLQMQREWSSLSQIGALTTYGDPFFEHPNGPNSRPGEAKKGLLGLGGGAKKTRDWEEWQWDGAEGVSSEMFRYLYWRFIKNFPVLNEAKNSYWTDHVQPMFDTLAERNLSSTSERSEVTKRRLLAMGLTRILGTYTSTCLRALGPSAPARPDIKIMKRIDDLLYGSSNKIWEGYFPKSGPKFTARTAVVDVEEIKGDLSFGIATQVLTTTSLPPFFVHRTYSDFCEFATKLDKANKGDRLNLPVLPSLEYITRLGMQHYLRVIVIFLSNPPPNQEGAPHLKEARDVLETFLLKDNEKLDKKETDAIWRDVFREDESLDKRRTLWVQAGKRAKKLRTTWAMFRDALVHGDEMERSFAVTKRTPLIKDLPEAYRDAEEWARVWVAYSMQYVFAVGPNSAEIVQLVKSFHSLIPYAALKLGLSLVNPTMVIKAVVAILFGQPGGQPSLFQRIFSIVMGGEVKTRKKEIATLRAKLGRDDLCDAIHEHVYAGWDLKEGTRGAAREDGEEILVSIMRDHASAEALRTVQGWHKAFVRRRSSEPPAEDSDAGRYQILKSMLRSYSLKRDREQVLEMVMESNTPAAIKASISLFYDMMWKVANFSNLAERLGDAQAFIDDLLKVSLSDNKDASDFIKLCARHDQSLYFWIHELHSRSNGELLKPLMAWCRSGLDFIKEGVPNTDGSRRRASTASARSQTAPKPAPSKDSVWGSKGRLGVDYDALLAETDTETRDAILLEMRDLALWTKYKKCYTDICLRADLIAVETGRKDFDKSALYSALLVQDRHVLELLDRRGSLGKNKERAEDEVAWAWYADDDVVNDPGSIKVDWKKAAEAEAEVARSRKKGKRGLLKRTTSRASTTSSVPTEDDEDDLQRLDVPAPRVRATKTLLDGFLSQFVRGFDAAKAQKIL